jgi:hypothetical protein
VSDIEAWQQLIADDSGHLGLNVHLTSRAGQEHHQQREAEGVLQRPGRAAVPGHARSGRVAARRGHHVRHPRRWLPPDGVGCRSYEAAHTRYLPNNKVVITTEYQIEGENIADTLNGQVEIGVAYNDTAIQIGPSSEVILDHMTKNRYLREAAARIVRIIHPECFVSATVA